MGRCRVSDGATSPEQADLSSGRRRRLKVIVGIGILAVLTFASMTIYAERKVNDENRRVQRLAASVTVNAQDILDAAYASSNKIGAAFGVANDRVSITIVGDNVPCIAIRSEYLTSSRSSAFLVGHDGALTPTAHC
jgi:hypothetical protein